MHYGECSCYQGCKNIKIKTVVLKEPDCMMIWMNWFDAEKFQRQIPKRNGRSVLITCCSLFYLTRRRRGPAARVEKLRREVFVEL